MKRKLPIIRMFLSCVPTLRKPGITKAWWILLAACSLAVSARAQNEVYAVEFGQSDNRFGTINLLTGRFTQISSLGGTMINDIACSPLDGTLYGIRDSSDLVTFDKTTGAVTTVASLNVPGIESLAFRPSDGVLFGATQSALYQIDPATGEATFIGDYGDAYNLGGSGQNIRFADDGNLYVSNTSANTDIYRVSTDDGSAVWVGEVTGFPNLILENGGPYMYGVSIAVGAPGGTQQELLAFDLSSFVDGGTNLDGTTHQIAYTMVGAGPQFPYNFNFSGIVPEQIHAFNPTCLLSIAPPQPDGSVLISGSGIVGQTYVLQASADLNQWTALSTNVADATGCFTFVDTDATNHPTCFFRTAVPIP